MALPPPGARGSYVLLLNLARAQLIRIGRLGSVSFPAGCYLYVGSARWGLRGRLKHHLNRVAKPRWHIDYLRSKATITGVLTLETGGNAECRIAAGLREHMAAVARFGASDCRCPGHLFHHPDARRALRLAKMVVNSLETTPVETA